jgi:electron transport complex protein RnfB
MENQMPVIDLEACTGCGKCVSLCPKGVLQLIPKRAEAFVPCSTKDKAKDVTSVCAVGCIHCMACTRKAKDIINMVNDRIEIDYARCDEECARSGVWACSRQFIFRYRDPARQAQAVEQLKAEQAAKKAAAAAKKAEEAAPKEETAQE